MSENGILAVLQQNLSKRKRERIAESKYDHNYTDTALDHRDAVAEERRVAQNFVGQRWHLYDTERYWNDKYYIPPDTSTIDAEKDCYADFETAFSHLEPYLENPDGSRILIIGCGMSSMARKLLDRGFHNIVNADSSTRLIKRMLRPEELVEGVDVVCVDATDLYMFPDDWFDLVIDKGMIDVMFTKTTMMTDVPKMVDEMSRVLAPGGTYFVFSMAPPPARQDYFQRKPLHWRLRIGKSTHGVHTYACTQPSKPSEEVNYF